MNKWLQTKNAYAWLIVASIVSAVLGTWLLGSTLEVTARQLLNLNSYPTITFVLYITGTVLLVIGGTYLLVLGFLVERKSVKVWIIVLNLALPMLLDCIDLTIRLFSIFGDLITKLNQ